jgi:hypothetical protein
MTQSLLRDRFKLRVRVEKRELPVYALVVARANETLGPGLQLSKIDCAPYSAALARSSGPGGAAPADVVSIFTALQEQLGLKLESRREPGDVVVIESVERPTPN